VVVVVNGPVLNVPEGLVPPVPEEEEHSVVFGDDQLISVLELYAMEVDAADKNKVGGVETSVVVPSRGPPQAPRARLNKIIEKALVTLRISEFMMLC